MKKLIIKGISLLNFKGFSKIHVPFNSYGAVILGGKNGYGKTTLFDALELLFTGKIQRMAEYNSYHNNRYSISQDEKPLVYNTKLSKEVVISAELEIADVHFVLRRKADVYRMRNPVDFNAFGKLLIVEPDEIERELTDEELKSLGIFDLGKSYSFLNYLSQEEATTFLKQKEADRAEMLSKLFDLEIYERYINKISKVQHNLGELKKHWQSQKKNADTLIKKLQSSGFNETNNQVEYLQISTDFQKNKWDAKSPCLSYEEFNAFLEENGIFDNLSYLAQNFSEYQKYRKNLYINQHNSEEEIHRLAFCTKYSFLEEDLKLYGEFQKNVLQPASSLTIFNLDSFTLTVPNDLEQLIKEGVLQILQGRINDLKEYCKSFGNIQKVQASILEMRNNLAGLIKNSSPETKRCPLCGHEYTSSKLLLQKLDDQGKLLMDQMHDSSVEIHKMLDSVKKEILVHVITPAIEYFTGKTINDEIFKEYYSLDIKGLTNTLNIFKEKLKITIDATLSVEAISETISNHLKSAILEYDETLDFKQMDKTYSSYGRFIKKECLNEDIIQKKRLYLTELWNKSKSEQLKRSERELNYINNILANIDCKINEFKSLQKDVQDSEKGYLRKLLSDIKILFYIYSGRIMQDNYFGRGLFIREDLDRKRVLITSSKDEHDEVDALFNMSSGQLVSLVVALTLSLNKLYSSVPFIAIDDPIQTMDDINLWGLIETLRHDFNNHFMVLSTHETDYGKLLEYKLRKWGIDTEYIEMSQLHQIQNEND
ncbi:AAA family ATPase [Prevotella copri]|uniref:AAA family ATPase n=1 Tax=Segatella copri TaxID=165179 RepID=A0AAW5IRF7_9BACT|nr:AAA family ATPase [Segatella copri]MCP9552815.1 AAA family ATPase [Segatella copri]MCP9576661.1 AAA family ATPase [Segatella copri]MCP9579445.1 AAA family ATPase [Segatella copri]MCP9588562.1 AAA family ATPase [Segatella copri]MCP9591175.1 AAA family ATPase [Segatella copri]